MTKVRIDFPYLKEDTDRHGNVRIYVRRNGWKIRIREPKGSPEFARAYAEAVHALENPTARKGPGRVSTASGHARRTGGRLLRLSPVQVVGPRVADDTSRHHRGLPTGAAQARLDRSYGALPP